MLRNVGMLQLLLMAQAVFLFSCKKNDSLGAPDNPVVPTPPPTTIDSATPLKDAANFPIGVAISYTPILNDAKYSAIVKRDFDAVTYDYHMKHGAVVKDDGTLDFTRPDQMMQALGNVEVFGHTLGWHQNQNASYLKTFSGLNQSTSAEMLTNPGFESSLNNWSIFNTGDPSGSATIALSNAVSEIHSGNSAVKVMNPTAYTGSQWKVQMASQLVPTEVGKQYIISYWIKAATANGSIRISIQDQNTGNAQYQSDQIIGTSWQKISWTFTASSLQTRFLLDMGQTANTYFIDDASFKEILPPQNGPQVAVLLDQALNNFITGMVGHYKSNVKAWDVINELFAEDGSIRNHSNTPTAANDVFVWSHYMGKDFALKAFNYAKAADPNALLYINDYNLESSSAKLNALVALVAELKSQGAKIDGIGTQMHISTSTSQSGIDQMMQKLAATGLKVRVSELDVRVGNGGAAGTPPGAAALSSQAAMYKYVVSSYLKNVPESQRAGITVWGLTDNTSWLYNNGTDYPLLFTQAYFKKPAYISFLQALKGQ